MNKEQDVLIESFRSHFEKIHGQEFYPVLFCSLLHPDPSFSITYEAEAIGECISYFGCTEEEFASVWRMDMNRFQQIITKKEIMSEAEHVRLSHATMLMLVGINSWGTRERFLDWLLFDLQFYNLPANDNYEEQELYLKIINDQLPYLESM